MFADFLRYYGVHLGGLVSEPATLTPSEVLALIQNLPEESRTNSALRGHEDAHGWSTEAYLLAALIDSVRDGTFANMQVRTKKKLPRPEPLPVPGLARPKKVNNFVTMAQAQFRKAGRL